MESKTNNNTIIYNAQSVFFSEVCKQMIALTMIKNLYIYMPYVRNLHKRMTNVETGLDSGTKRKAA